MRLVINPHTKVGQVLDAYPGIEDELIAWVPAFSKLRNPILRKTVAKVATLEQAARIGGVTVRELVLRLRRAAGQEDCEVEESAAAASPESAGWIEGVTITRHLDADMLLARGENPLGVVSDCVARLKCGEAVRLTSTFRPVPLLDHMARQGIRCRSDEAAPGEFVTYFGR